MNNNTSMNHEYNNTDSTMMEMQANSSNGNNYNTNKKQ